ncbi:MAG: TraR/DksA C4-type zinc finger protein [Verrucomicrobia bacterium]|nr:TraR/DksA C4-type zinc finger protein [Verrucomicrobiota bacterium]
MTDKNKTAKKVAAQAKPKRAATVASILGTVMAKGNREFIPVARISSQWADYHEHLLELRDRLLHQMSGLAKESAEELPGYSLHMADSGTDNFDRDFALSLLSADQDALYEVEEALKRIEKKTYGICELTGKPIPKARLQAIPWTRFTVEAQSQLEKEGALKQRRLGALGTVDGSAPVESDEDEEPVEEKPAKEKD